MLINESHLSNQQIEIIRMFLDSEFSSKEFSVLVYFTHKFKLTFLYCVEINTQARCSILPKLNKDLKEKNITHTTHITLQQFFVPYHHVDVQKPSTDTELNLLDLMCVDAAHVLMQQCGRQYGFATEDLCGENAQATKYIFFQLKNLFIFLQTIFLLSNILLISHKEHLFLTS